MLKGLPFAVASWLAASVAAGGAPSTLLVGSVRDAGGRAIAGAGVNAADAAGHAVGSDVTDSQGTFAVRLSGAASTLDIRCRHCAPARLDVRGRGEVAAIVQRYGALESDIPQAADIAALPYPRIGDVLGLVPFVLASGGGASDRGLDRGRTLVVDDGAPVANLATGGSALGDFPDRYVRTIDIVPPVDAFRYGLDGGGGRFALDQSSAEGGSASFDVGQASSLALQPALGPLHPSFGVSSDDGSLIRRGDVDVATPFAGGYLRGGADGTSSFGPTEDGTVARHLDSTRLSYATASRRYRTFFDVSSTSVGQTDVEGDAYGASYLAADVRVERPGPLTLAFGAAATQQSGYYKLGEGFEASGRIASETLYAEASAGDTLGSATAGLALTDVSSRGAFLVPSLSARAPFASNAYLRAAFSESLRVPSLLEAAALPGAPQTSGLERGELSEAAAGYDGNRWRAEALVFEQFLHGVGDYRLQGTGASAVWQLAPRFSVRAWTLRDAPFDYVLPASLSGNVSRQIVWTTYANGTGLRFDAIVHRDAAPTATASGLDGDVWLPLAPGFALDIGTSQTTARTFYAGLRATQR